jgi:hypothetical protein
METIYLNAATNPFGPHATLIALQRWSVVNAPRPLPGSITFVGPYAHGIYFAAGPQAVFGERWRDLDAWPVELITNLQIVERLSAIARARGTTLAAVLEDQELSELSADVGFPWYIAPGSLETPATMGASNAH